MNGIAPQYRQTATESARLPKRMPREDVKLSHIAHNSGTSSPKVSSLPSEGRLPSAGVFGSRMERNSVGTAPSSSENSSGLIVCAGSGRG